MSYATPIKSAIQVHSHEVMPDGTRCLMVAVTDYADYKKTPAAVEYQGRVYGRTGWNSDRMVAYFKSDREFGQKVG